MIKLNVQLSQKLILTPQLKNAIEILHMSALELKSKIEQEIQENPFLEEETTESENKETAESSTETPGEIETYFEDSSDSGYVKKSKETYDSNSNSNFIEGVLSQSETLQEHLIWQLQLSFDDEKSIAIGKAIISNITEDGFFTADLSEIAEFLGVPLEDVKKILAVIQTFEPYGVAARDLQESLLNQIKFMPQKDPWAQRILSEFFELLRKKKYIQIGKALGISEKTVLESVDFIGNLNPSPGLEYTQKKTVYVVPDVIIKKIDGNFVVMMHDAWLPNLTINSYYESLSRSYSTKDSTKKFLNDKYFSALWFLKNIEQRRMTVYKVSKSILKHQKVFFEEGSKKLVPLILQDIADDIEMHASTVSRVTNGKYMQTPSGIYEFKYFFSSKLKSQTGDDFSSRSVKEIIKDLIAAENKPYSDLEIVELLSSRGIQISRRTVTKYRKLLRILPSYLRKK